MAEPRILQTYEEAPTIFPEEEEGREEEADERRGCVGGPTDGRVFRLLLLPLLLLPLLLLLS